MSYLPKSILLGIALSIVIPQAAATNIPLGAAANYVILFSGSSTGKTLQIDDADILANATATIQGNIGIGSGEFKENNKNSTIEGSINFAAADTGQYSGSTSNVGPTAVNYSVAAVTTAIADMTALSTSLEPFGAPLAINGPQTVNQSDASTQTINGVTYSIFDVSSYTFNDGEVLTINGNGSGNPVVFNFNFNSNLNFKGTVHLNGLTPDQVLFNYTGTGNVDLASNSSTQGTILAPNAGSLEMQGNATLEGRFFGSFNSGDATIHSGAVISAYPGGGPLNGAPEPSSVALLAVALAGLAATMRRRQSWQPRLVPVG